MYLKMEKCFHLPVQNIVIAEGKKPPLSGLTELN